MITFTALSKNRPVCQVPTQKTPANHQYTLAVHDTKKKS